MSGRRIAVTAAVVLLALRNELPAHHSPAEEIVRLSDRLAAAGADARLLTARGYAYVSLGLWSDAAADFRHALELEPRSRVALHGAIDVSMQQSAYEEAESLARRAIMQARDPMHAPAFHALHARVLTRQKRWAEALWAWRRALETPQPEIDWFLGEAEVLGKLGRQQEKCNALASAMERNPSVVLRHSWIRALVDAHRLEHAAEEIETELGRSRWRSSWLLLRARVALLQNDPAAAQADALAARAELEQRGNSKFPDPVLEQELAEALRLADSQ